MMILKITSTFGTYVAAYSFITDTIAAPGDFINGKKFEERFDNALFH